MATREAFLCDAVRTPIGRYGGALAKVRTDDLAAAPIKALMARHPKIDWEKLDEVYFGCANQAGEDNRNVARMALLLAGLPASVPGMTHQPAVRLGHGSGRHRGARHPRRRDGIRHRRRRRIDDAGAVRAGQGAGGLRARGRDLRHHHRLALHQSADEEPIWRRFHAGNRRERRRGIPDQPRRSGRLRGAIAAARRRGDRPRLFHRARSSRSKCPAARAARSWSTATSIRGRTPRSSSSPSSRRRSATTARSPPATPPASMTAPPRSSSLGAGGEGARA